MRLLSFRHEGKTGFGAVSGDGVVDLGRRLGGGIDSVRALLERGALARAVELAAKTAPDYALADIAYLLPVPEPEKILCVGINYARRNDEYRDGRRPSERPNLFLRTARSFVPHEGAIVRPHVSDQLDYEGEIALVIGKAGRYIAEADAAGHIAGATIANEGTIRDWLKHSRSNITQGKNFDASGSIGPWIDTDALGSVPLRVQTWVNEELRQDDDTSNLIYDFPYLVSYISQFTTLAPGDVILTGTPTGAGARFDPPKFLVPGDTLRIAVSGVGVLENPIVDEPGAMRARDLAVETV